MKPLSFELSDHSNSVVNPDSTPFCRKLSDFTETVDTETKQLDNILRDLRNYYATVKTKRQLGLDVPAGFCRDNIHKQQFVLHSPSRTTANLSSELLGENISSTSTTDNTLIDSMNLLPATAELLHPENTSHPTHSTNPSSLPIHIPIVRSVDKASSSLPKKMTMSEDFLCSCVGYRHIDTLKKQSNNLYQDTVHIDHTPPDAVLDPGCFASKQFDVKELEVKIFRNFRHRASQ
jgi:hypothetical protein